MRWDLLIIAIVLYTLGWALSKVASGISRDEEKDEKGKQDK